MLVPCGQARAGARSSPRTVDRTTTFRIATPVPPARQTGSAVPDPDRTHPDGSAATRAAFTLFVEQLVARPDRAELIADLEGDHEPDADGWCRHPVHDVVTDQPEQHPCTTSRLVATIRRAVQDATGSRMPGP
jgi:hypothetical protein